MHSVGARPLCWPTLAQEHLLQFLFGPDEDAPRNWTTWRSSTMLAALEYGSVQLLPLAYRRLLRLGMRDPEMNLLKGAYRRTWVSNQLLLAKALPAVDALARASVPVMGVKGIAVLGSYDNDLGLRPMRDLDLFVREDSAERAVDVVIAEGWTPSPKCALEYLKREVLRMEYAWTFVRSGAEVDLHWHALYRDPSRAVDSIIWSHARNASVLGRAMMLPNPTEQLFWACIHGTYWNTLGIVTWIADAVVIVRTAGDAVDWDRLVDLAIQRRLTLTVRDAFLFLHDALGVRIPSKAMRSLENQRSSEVERLEYEAIHRAWRSDSACECAMDYLLWCRRSPAIDLRHSDDTAYTRQAKRILSR